MEVKTGLGQVSLLLVLVGLLSVALTSTAVAAPTVGKNGQVNACYRVKGKAKGAMRVVPAGKKCRKGERKLAWSVTGPPGTQGAAGTQGGQGAQGTPGSNGTNGAPGTPGTASVALETKIASLTLQVESLEGILDGVTNLGLTNTIAGLPAVETGLSGLTSDVTGLTSNLTGLTSNVTGLTSNVKGVEDVLKGVTNAGLTEAVKTVPQVGALCTQATALTAQSNLLGSAFGKIKVLGGLVELELPKVDPLTGFAC